MDEKEIEVEGTEEEAGPDIIYEGEEGYEEKAEAPILEDDDEVNEPEDKSEIKSDKPKKPRIAAKTRINQITRKAHEESRRAEKAERELASIREENDRLRKLSENSSKAMLSSQESMIDSHIRNAKQIKAKAIEDGDISAQIDADEALAAAVSDKRRIDEYKMQQKMYEEDQKTSSTRQHAQQNHQEPQEQYVTPEASEWLEENPWFDEDSDDFDPDLQQKAITYSNHLNNKYQKMGKLDRISTYEYFDDINRYMSRHLQPETSQQKQSHSKTTGELVMNRPRGTVAGVGRSQPMGNQRETFRMSKDEQDMARAMGWSDQQWFQNKKLASKMEAEGRLNTGFGNGRG